MIRWLVLAAVMTATACGDASGPVQTSRNHAQIAGTWRFNFTNMAGIDGAEALVCTATGMDFTITQNRGAFAGVQVADGLLICVEDGAVVIQEAVGGETIISGELDGNDLTFRLGSVGGDHSGTVTGTSISGAAQWIFDTGVTLEGQFSATRL